MKKIIIGTRPAILDKVQELGFVTFENNDYDLNIIGVRNPNGTPNKFDDKLHVCFLSRGIWHEHIYPITTDAGLYWLNNPTRVAGTAILCHNRQYRGSHVIGLHQGKYPALVQRGNDVSVWRDGNRDDYHNTGGKEDTGFFGINIHRASEHHESTEVNKWSAGCQVFANPEDFKEFMELCNNQVLHLGVDRFTYTLLLGE